VGVRNFNLQSGQVRKGWNIGLNQSLIYIHPFLPLSNKFLLFVPLQLNIQKNIFLGIKNIDEQFVPLGLA